MAIHRPRLFIAEAGNSFGLFADYCAELELSVNKVSIKPGCGISLAPFADAYKLIEAPVKTVDESELSERIEVEKRTTAMRRKSAIFWASWRLWRV